MFEANQEEFVPLYTNLGKPGVSDFFPINIVGVGVTVSIVEEQRTRTITSKNVEEICSGIQPWMLLTKPPAKVPT